MTSHVTPKLNLIVPGPTSEPGPEYAQEVSDNFDKIDATVFSPNNKVPSDGLAIDDDVDFNITNNITRIRAVRFATQANTLGAATDVNEIYVVLGDLYYNDASGTPVKITSQGQINIGALPVSTWSSTSITSDTTIAANTSHTTFFVDTSFPWTVTLPPAAAVTPGRIFLIVDATGGAATTGPITLLPDGLDNIDGFTTVTLDQPRGQWMVISDGNDGWHMMYSQRSNIQGDATFTIDGTLMVSPTGGLVVQSNGFINTQAGSLINHQGLIDVLSGGTLDFENGAIQTFKSGSLLSVGTGGVEHVHDGGAIDVDNNGALNVGPGGQLYVKTGGQVLSRGEFDFDSGGKLHFTNTASHDTDGLTTFNAYSVTLFAGNSILADNSTWTSSGGVKTHGPGSVEHFTTKDVNFSLGAYLSGSLQMQNDTSHTFTSPMTRTVAQPLTIYSASLGTYWVIPSITHTMGISDAIFFPMSWRDLTALTNSGDPIIFNLTNMHDGATLTGVTVSMVVSQPHASLPTAKAGWNLVYNDVTDPSPNWATLAGSTWFGTNGASWYAGGVTKFSTVTGLSHVVDKSKYTYMLYVTDESGPGALPYNYITGITCTFTVNTMKFA